MAISRVIPRDPQVLEKREVTITDSTEAAILGADVIKVSLTNLHQFHRVVVRMYQGKHQLSFPKCSATITLIRTWRTSWMIPLT